MTAVEVGGVRVSLLVDAGSPRGDQRVSVTFASSAVAHSPLRVEGGTVVLDGIGAGWRTIDALKALVAVLETYEAQRR